MLKVGDKVECRYFNYAERVYYGGSWTGEILEIRDSIFKLGVVDRPYRVTRYSGGPQWLGSEEVDCDRFWEAETNY
jgi:hypothetical protein